MYDFKKIYSQSSLHEFTDKHCFKPQNKICYKQLSILISMFFLGMYAIIKADIYLNKRYFHLVDEIIKINSLCVCYACA